MAGLEASGVKLKRWGRKNMYFGGVHAVVSTDAGMSGAGDLRRGGVSIEVGEG
jgi:gamma-glutamyltranspeptidase